MDSTVEAETSVSYKETGHGLTARNIILPIKDFLMFNSPKIKYITESFKDLYMSYFEKLYGLFRVVVVNIIIIKYTKYF